MNIEKSWGKLLKVLPFALFIIVALIFAFTFKVTEIKGFLQQHEKFGVIISLFVFVLLGVTPVPNEPVALLVLAWQGPVVAILIATMGNTLAALLEYYIGGNISDITNFEKKKEKLPFHLGRLPVNSPAFLLFARMLPWFGPKLVGYVGGVYQVPLFTYMWTAFVANLSGSVLLVGASYGIIKHIL